MRQDPPAEHVDDGGEIDEATRHWKVGDVHRPHWSARSISSPAADKGKPCARGCTGPAVVADAGRRPAVRRRHDHAGDQRLVGGRRARRRRARLRTLCPADHRRLADRTLRDPVQGRIGNRRRFRAPPDRLVRHDRRSRLGRDRARASHPGGVQSRAWRRLPCARRAGARRC